MVISLARLRLTIQLTATTRSRKIPNAHRRTWFALMAPAGTLPEIISELSKATTTVLASADFQKALEAQGVVSQDQGAAPFKQFLSEEIDKWHNVAQQINLVPQ